MALLLTAYIVASTYVPLEQKHKLHAVDVCIEGLTWLSCLLFTSLLTRMDH
jgi:hypothetical protein